MIDILLVEDDKEICFILTELLKRNPYNVSAYHNGIEAIEALSSKKYDLMLLDLMLPDLPGEKILFHLKKHNNSIPVIVISAKNQPEIRINLLRSGADDYITKPFLPLELVARVKAQLRRYKKYNVGSAVMAADEVFKYAGLTMNIKTYECRLNGETLSLTPTEFSILRILLERKCSVVSAEELFHEVWQEEYYTKSNNTITVHIRHLREKMKDTGENPRYIKTVWGVGYKIGEI